MLEFDETLPYLKAHKPFSREQMRAAIGRGRIAPRNAPAVSGWKNSATR